MIELNVVSHRITKATALAPSTETEYSRIEFVKNARSITIVEM